MAGQTRRNPARKVKEARASSGSRESEVGRLKKRDLIEEAVVATGLKRRDVKRVAEALLQSMGRAVERGESLTLEPLGKLRVARSVETDKGAVLTCKLRRKSVSKSPDAALAVASKGR